MPGISVKGYLSSILDETETTRIKNEDSQQKNEDYQHDILQTLEGILRVLVEIRDTMPEKK